MWTIIKYYWRQEKRHSECYAFLGVFWEKVLILFWKLFICNWKIDILILFLQYSFDIYFQTKDKTGINLVGDNIKVHTELLVSSTVCSQWLTTFCYIDGKNRHYYYQGDSLRDTASATYAVDLGRLFRTYQGGQNHTHSANCPLLAYFLLSHPLKIEKPEVSS